MSKRDDETVMEYLRRAVHWLDVNPESLLDDLPSIPALIELFDLISDTYDTSSIEEMYEIAEEDKNWKPLRAFIKKYKLPWRTE